MKSRAKALRYVILIAAMVFIAVSLSVILHSHLCTETECPLCRLTDGDKQGVILLISSFFLFIPRVTCNHSASDTGRFYHPTPVMERVKLNS